MAFTNHAFTLWGLSDPIVDFVPAKHPQVAVPTRGDLQSTQTEHRKGGVFQKSTQVSKLKLINCLRRGREESKKPKILFAAKTDKQYTGARAAHQLDNTVHAHRAKQFHVDKSIVLMECSVVYYCQTNGTTLCRQFLESSKFYHFLGKNT